MAAVTIEELIAYLDGRGLTVTDDDLIAEALYAANLAPQDGFETADRFANVAKVREAA